MAKKTVAPKPPSPKAALTLADITITWGPEGRERHMSGVTIAKWVHYASTKHRYLEDHDPKVGTLRVGPMLRGLGGWLFRDAGIPQEELESDMRFFLSEVLDDIAAEVESSGSNSDSMARIYRVNPVAPKGRSK